MKIIYTDLSQYSPSGRIYVEHGGRNKTFPPCCNNCYMVAYIAHGTGTLVVDKTITPIIEGDVFLFNPDVVYRILPIQGLRRVDVYLCYFDFGVIENSYSNFTTNFLDFEDFFDKNISFIHSVDPENKEVRDIFIRMIDEQMSDMISNYDIIRGYLPIMLTKIFRNAKTREFKRVYSQNRTVDEAIRYINQQMYSKISLIEIAQELKVSPSYICRQFKKHTGMTTSQFINLLRVDKIKDILKNTDKPIKTIPEMFNCNIDYLKKVFKNEIGMSMQEYRDKYNYRRHSPNEN